MNENERPKKQRRFSRRFVLAAGGAAVATAGFDRLRETLKNPEQTHQQEDKHAAPFPITDQHIKDFIGFLYYADRSVSTLTYSRDEWSHEGHIGHLEKAPWGGPCSIVYTRHTHERKVDNIPADIDVITLEGVDQGLAVDYSETDLLRKHPEVPVYAVDVGTERMKELLLVKGVDAVISTVGLTTLLRGIEQQSVLFSAIGAHLSGEIGTGIATLTGDFVTGKNDVIAGVQKSHEEMPSISNFIIVVLRNIIAAEKNEFIARMHSQTSEDPIHLVSVWGAGHTGIEVDILRSQEERLQILKRWKPLIKFFYGDDFSIELLWICSEQQTEVIDGKVTLKAVREIEVPSLKAIFDDE